MSKRPHGPLLPYGVADFAGLRRSAMAYIDKTRFIRPLERFRFAFLVRPRRFGKSLWVSILENYYDRTRRSAFGTVFGGTDIGADPTPEQGRHIVLRFDFSMVGSDLNGLEERFDRHCRIHIEAALRRNADVIPSGDAGSVVRQPTAVHMLEQLFALSEERDFSLCVLVDEYDNFANSVIAERGEAAYHDFTHGSGFFRHFFAALKGGTLTGGIGRLFLTGVSPITLDDVTSGFNIARNISLSPVFNEIVGFTESEVRALVQRYSDHGAFRQDVDEALEVMNRWYDGYRFSEDATATVYNPVMVLYYLAESIERGNPPRRLIDDNVRIDYQGLRHLVVVGRRTNGSFDLLRNATGKEREVVRLETSWPLRRLGNRANFLSLLHYFGLLSIRGHDGDRAVLGIPNETVRRLLYGFLRDAWEDLGLFSLDADRLIGLFDRMARDGDWRPMVTFLADRFAEQTGIHDSIDGEKALHYFLLGYFGLSRRFRLRSEVELGKGYADMVLFPSRQQTGWPHRGFVIELKYLKRADPATPEAVESLLGSARTQLRRYLSDPALARRRPQVAFTGLALVFRGWELVASESVTPASLT